MLAVVAHRRNATNGELAERGAVVVSPAAASRTLSASDVALGRIDVRRDLAGIEFGITALRRLERSGVTVLNPADALTAMHDKLRTAIRLRDVNLPHPRTVYIDSSTTATGIELPAVVKPRFGSWGRDIYLCMSRAQLRRCLGSLREKAWFRQQGAIVQELIPPTGRDLRVLVAKGTVIGAIERVSAPGEWRTNVALGATRHRAQPTRRARALAIAAAASVGGDLVGVDLLPARGGYVIAELNGAVEFTAEYSLDDRDVFALAVAALSQGSVPRAA